MENTQNDIAAFARTVIDALDSAGITYLIGGSVAVWHWGQPRTTQDFDVVLDLPGNRIVQLSRELEARRMLVPPDIIIDLMIQPEGDLPINAIHLDNGFKAEFFLLRAGDNFRAEALRRRRLVDLGPPLNQVYVHAPEDLIINKVRYFGLSGQTKHIRDIASMLALSSDEIDTRYIDQWAEQLGLTDTWQEVYRAAQELLDSDSI